MNLNELNLRMDQPHITKAQRHCGTGITTFMEMYDELAMMGNWQHNIDPLYNMSLVRYTSYPDSKLQGLAFEQQAQAPQVNCTKACILQILDSFNRN